MYLHAGRLIQFSLLWTRPRLEAPVGLCVMSQAFDHVLRKHADIPDLSASRNPLVR